MCIIWELKGLQKLLLADKLIILAYFSNLIGFVWFW